MKLALGLMSGTSADGVSLALVRVGAASSRSLKVLSSCTYPYSRGLRARVLAARAASGAEFCRLNFELGRLYASAALRFLKAARVSPGRLEVAGSHGQTVVHLPGGRSSSTLQIGEASFLAESLGVPVVADFRPRDMAAGGEGAPLAPLLDEWLFGGGPPRALQNIGGIANVSLVGRGVPVLGFDTGPGNCLIDLAVRRITRGRSGFDKGGVIAGRGEADERRARRLLSRGYFVRQPPKSLDYSDFGERYLRRHFLRPGVRPEDAVATATFFTALTIADAYRRFLYKKAKVREAVVSGGGSLNPVLMGHLRRLLAPLPVRAIAEFGLPPLAKEPALIALMALLAVEGKVNHCPGATGARGPRILGKIIPSQ